MGEATTDRQKESAAGEATSRRRAGPIVFLLALGLGGCLRGPPDEPDSDSARPDAGIDAPAWLDAEADSEPDLRRPDADAHIDPPPPDLVAYFVTLGLDQLSGRLSWGPAKPDAGPPLTLMRITARFDSWTATVKPDFIDSPTPPNCIGYKWSKGQVPSRTAGDAGTLTITGHGSATYIDLSSPSVPAQPVPSPLVCTRKELLTGSGLYGYDCGLPLSLAGRLVVLASGSIIDDSTQIGFGVSGGKDVGPFNVTGLTSAAPVKPKATFDLNQIDPTGIVAEWETTSAVLVAFELSASLKDGSESAEIACLMLSAMGTKKTIPAGALALLPKATSQNPLLIVTSLVGQSVKGSVTAWGKHMGGVGRGSFGVSCWDGAAPCAAP